MYGRLILGGFITIGVGCGVVEGEVIVHVSVRVESARFGGAGWVHVDGPSVVHHPGAFGNEETFVPVVCGRGVWDGAEDCGRHPSCLVRR
jgi:hypothetical protein